MQAQRFGPRSEQLDSAQIQLFNEAELASTEAAGEPDTEPTVPVRGHQLKVKPGRKPLPEDLPREDVIHDLPASEKWGPRNWPHDGHRLVKIGEDVSEQLAIIPQRVKVLRHIRPKYGCPHREQGVHIAPPPPPPIPKSIASPSLLAFILIAQRWHAP